MGLMVNAYNIVDKQIITNINKNNYTIILDAGHGGEDGGASCNGVVEKDINLAITKKLYNILIASGVDVKLTRDADISIHDKDKNTIRSRKVSDIHNRLKIANSSDKNILISIHQNKFEDSKYSGAQIFYSTKNEKSKEIASKMQNAIVSAIQPENKREIKPAGKNIYLLYNSNVPALIIECGFLSNPEEAKKLSDDEYQKKFALAIYCGLMDYLG